VNFSQFEFPTLPLCLSATIASPLYEINRTTENDEAAHKQSDKCVKSIVAHFYNPARQR
jgi:hypothetical protein